MVFDEIQIIIRKYSLQNAILFNGKANTKSVLGKIFPILQKKGLSPKEIIPLVEKIVKEVNKISLNDQIKELEKIAPDLLVKEKKERDYSLPELPNAIYGKVVTRFPPEPNGYLHIGHAKAAVVDYEYAKKYDGKFILRFDDTNPLNADEKFYSAQKKDLEWLDIKWDEEYCTSNNLEKHYELAEKLINQDNAYICDCSPDDIKKNRSIKKNCKCRNNSTGENLDYWKNIISSSKDGMVLRLKGKMDSNNTAMRDPTLFRIIEFPHPLQGDKYRVWPTYDFAGAIEDSLSGVTHPFRTKEYELRDECYFYLLDLLKLRKPNLMEFARLSIRGMPVSKRKIKPLIDKNLVNGYDDIRLPTLMGLKKRGILAESIKKFVISQGISKVESIVSFSLVEAENRKILDPITKRYFFVSNPIEINVINAKKMEKSINLHPKNKKLGSRKIQTDNIFYVPKEDMDNLKIGTIFRLKDLYNVKIIDKNKTINVEYIGDDLIPNTPKIQWTNQQYINLKISISHDLFINDEYNPDSLKNINGFAEKEISSLKSGEIVQFERFGFVRIENKNNQILGFFTHK